MIKANVILDNYKWKNKIKNPTNYFKKREVTLNTLPDIKQDLYH